MGGPLSFDITGTKFQNHKLQNTFIVLSALEAKRCGSDTSSGGFGSIRKVGGKYR